MRPWLALSMTLATAWAAAAPEVSVAPAAVRIAVVFPHGATEPARLNRRLGAELAERFRERGVAAADVRTDCVSARAAAAMLDARACDAVIVLGGERPQVLRRISSPAWATNLGRAYAYRPAYLILGKMDSAREQWLSEVIPEAVRGLGRRGGAE